MLNYLSHSQDFTVLDAEVLRGIQNCSRDLCSGAPHWTPELVLFKKCHPSQIREEIPVFQRSERSAVAQTEQTQHPLPPSEELPQSKHQQEQIFLSYLYFHVVPLEQSSCARTTWTPDFQIARNSHFKALSIKLSLSKTFTGCNCQFNPDIWSLGLRALWG